jgi:filamentous hemagglutinin family protein
VIAGERIIAALPYRQQAVGQRCLLRQRLFMSRSRWHVGALVLGAALYAFGAVVPHGYAQVTTAITSDGTLGTTVARSGNLYNINGGTIKGTNQFHSFGQFSVGTGDIASFNGPATIQNILSRVTGGTRSEIDGTLRSTISGANLYLLNPSGILFGPNAQLDVSGSFHATTANYIGLADGARFNAVPSSADNLLTTAPPAAFGFLTLSPAPIDVQAGVGDFDVGITNVLQVPASQTLSFVGGPISVGAAPGAFAGGFMLAPGGRINIASVASPGEARFDGTGFSVDTFARLGDISIKGNSIIDGKEVFIRGGRLVIEQASILPGFFFLNGVSGDPPNGGEVNIQVSDSVNIKGPPQDFNGFSGILTVAGLPFPGDVPHISIKASSISLSEGGVVQTVRQGPGNPSNISIEADTVEVRSGASIAARNEFEGPGGTLTVNARNVTLDSAGSDQFTGLSAQAFFHPDYGFADETGSFAKAFLPSLQLADSGSITVNATGTLTMRGSAQISSDNFAFGKSGNVTVNAGDMLLVGAGANTGLISAQSRLAGRAGDVTINASGSIDMQNGFRISANTLGSDDGGQANVKAGRSITMSGNSTFISSITGQPVDSELDTFAGLFFSFFQATRGIEILDYSSLRAALGVAPGPSDLMNVLAALSTISDGAGNPLVAVTDFTPGAGGKVSITTPGLAVNDGAHIETSTVWDGNAGAIEVNVGSLTLHDGAIIGSRSGAVRPDRGFTVGTGNAGTVDIAATGTVEISGRSPTSGEGSVVTTNTFGDGKAGNISVSANQVNVQNGGIISSESGGTVNGQLFVGSGNAGNINIVVGDTLRMDGGTITTASAAAAGGNITITSTGSLLHMTDSQITTSVSGGAGGGGNITIGAELVDPATSTVTNIHPFDFIVLNNSGIHADSRGGAGGRINIFTDIFLSSIPVATAVTASSGVNQPGTIDIQATVTEFSNDVSQLPEVPLQATELLRATCAARVASGRLSSLVLGGRGGLPLEPGGLLPSPLYLGPDSAISFDGHGQPGAQLTFSSNFSVLPLDNARPPSRTGWDQFQLAKTTLGLDCSQ